MFRRFVCRWVGCLRCRPFETADGIGGLCTDCGKIHGWVTREELLAYADRMVRDPAEWTRVEAEVERLRKRFSR
jgi:hypothetical protein